MVNITNWWYDKPMNDNMRQVNQAPLGESEAFINFQEQLSQVAKINRSVLIVGERGSGKEIAATRLHFLSHRWQSSLITVNCASLPPSLIETELFGHEAGAFTGANKARKGRFEEADKGTLFLDEIGLIPIEVQEKILRVVEYGTFERVGSSRSHEVDVRIIGATNADLPKLCADGKFKEDLLDRLSFEVLFLPPLRERGGDIFLLAHYFASKMALECGIEGSPRFSQSVLKTFASYSWPGNVRELKNVVERAVYRAESAFIEEIVIDPFNNPFAKTKEREKVPQVSTLNNYEEAKRELDILYITSALKEAGGSQKGAAQILGLSYDQFRGLFRKYKDVVGA